MRESFHQELSYTRSYKLTKQYSFLLIRRTKLFFTRFQDNLYLGFSVVSNVNCEQNAYKAMSPTIRVSKSCKNDKSLTLYFVLCAIITLMCFTLTLSPFLLLEEQRHQTSSVGYVILYSSMKEFSLVFFLTQASNAQVDITLKFKIKLLYIL